MEKYIFERLNEASTWKALVYLATSLGVELNPDQAAAIVSIGLAIVGFIGAFFPDKFRK